MIAGDDAVIMKHQVEANAAYFGVQPIVLEEVAHDLMLVSRFSVRACAHAALKLDAFGYILPQQSQLRQGSALTAAPSQVPHSALHTLCRPTHAVWCPCYRILGGSRLLRHCTHGCKDYRPLQRQLDTNFITVTAITAQQRIASWQLRMVKAQSMVKKKIKNKNDCAFWR